MSLKKLFSLLAGVVLILSLAAMSSADDQKKPSTKEDRLTGTVHMIDKDTSTIIIRKGAVQRKIVTMLKRNLRSRTSQVVPSTM